MKKITVDEKLHDRFSEFLDEKFKNNEIDFKQLVDAVKSIKDYDNVSCLYKLLENKELFEELIQNNKLNTKDLKYLWSRIDNANELDGLCENKNRIL